MRILVAEDNDVNWEIISMLLQMYGVESERAEDGQLAVDRIKQAKEGDYQLIFMDIQMPVMNGYEATKAIRALSNPQLANIPIIAMTANAFSEDIQAAKDAGMTSHIAKPIDVPKMMDTLEEVLG